MALVSGGVAQVEAQLRAIRTRLNGLLIQDAASISLSITILMAAAVVGAALRAPAAAFVIAAGLGLSAAAATTAICVWRAWRRWLSPAAAVHFVDHRAQLDGRLATLHAAASWPSPLLPILVDQALASRDAWSLSRLAPHRVARSAALVPASLAILAAAAFYARPPASSSDRASVAPMEAAQGVASAGGSSRDNPETAPLARQRSESGLGRNGSSAAPPGATARADGSAQAAGTRFDVSSPPAQPARTAAESLRQAIRAALDGESPTHPRAGGASHPSVDRKNGESPVSTAAAPSTEGAQSRAPRRGKEATSSDRVGGAGAGRGDSGSMPGGMLSDSAPDNESLGSDQAKPVAISLRAFAIAAPSTAEPQISPDRPNVPTGAGVAEPPLPSMDAQQSEDAALQRGMVPPEHERIVRNIFTRP